MKKWIALLLALAMGLMLIGCGKRSSDEPEPSMSVSESEEMVDEELEDSIGDSTAAQDAFFKAINLKQEDLVVDLASVSYEYNGARLLVKDYERIDGELVIDQSALYNAIASKMAQCCANEGYMFDHTTKQFFEMLLGTEKPSSFEEFKSIVKKLGSYIVYDSSEREIFKALESSGHVKGSFDYNSRTYSFEIKDTRKAANDLLISEEMLGYMLAATSVYSVEIDKDYQWNGNSVKISLSVDAAETPPQKSFDPDQISILSDGKFNMTCTDFLASIGDIGNAIDSDIGTLKHSSEENVGWIYKVVDRTPIATLTFYDGEQKASAEGQFDICSGLFSYDDTAFAASLIGMIMLCDPALSKAEAYDLCEEMLGEVDNAGSSSRELDDLIIGIVPAGQSEFIITVNISK